MTKIDFLISIKQKPLTALCLFPSGLGKEMAEEIQSILSDPWIPEKKNTCSPKLFRFPEKILIHNISLQSILGLAFRSYFLRDIYISLGDIKDLNIPANLPKDLIEWIQSSRNFSIQFLIRKNINLNPDVLLKNWNESLQALIQESDNSKKPFNDQEILPSPRLLLNTIRNQSSLYLAIKSKPNYQRGFRIPFSQSAPLSEDLTAVLINKLLNKMEPINQSVNSDFIFNQHFYIPFSGTGTIAFEIYLQILKIFPGILQITNELAIQKLGGDSYWQFLTNKHRILLNSKSSTSNLLNSKSLNPNLSENPNLRIECLDFRASILENAKENADRFQSSLNLAGILPENQVPSISKIQWILGDFFEKPILPTDSEILFLPLNPPYGIRHQNRESTGSFYRRIATKIDGDTFKFPLGKQIHGFILCPDEASYSGTVSVWEKNWNLETVHFSQGKLSIRAVFFSRIL